MTKIPFSSQYRRLNRRMEDLSPVSNALLAGVIFFAFWMGSSVVFGAESLQQSALMGVISALAISAIHYWVRYMDYPS